MLHYHKEGVTLTLEFATPSDCHFFQDGLLELMAHVAQTTEEHPVSGTPLSALARMLQAMMLSETQHKQAAVLRLKAA